MGRQQALDNIDTNNKSLFMDKQGRYFTQGLFCEYELNDYPALYTLGEKDVVKEDRYYPSLKRLYLDMEDIGEYNFVQKYLYSWLQWEKMLKNNILRPFINQWRDELEIKLRSIAIKTLCDLSSTSEAKNTAAAKYIANKDYATKETKKDKEAKQHQITIEEQLSKETRDDMKRIGLVRNHE